MKQLIATLLLLASVCTLGHAAISFSGLSHGIQANNVLRYNVSFSVSPAARAYVQYYHLEGTDTIWGYTDIKDSAANHQFTLLGLLPQTTYRFRPAAFDVDGIFYDGWNTFTTAALPNDIPTITSVPVADAANTGGYIMTLTVRFGLLFPNVGETAQIYDRKGNLVWYEYVNRIAPGGLKQCTYAYPITGQRMLFTNCHEIVEVGLDGTEHHRSQLQGADTNFYFHHDVIKKNNGNYLAIAAKPIRLDFSDVGGPADSLVMSEAVLEVDTTGNIVWQWNAYEQLDTNNLVENVTGFYWVSAFPNSGNWLHANGLALDLDGGILLSLRTSSQVFKINPNNKSLIFTMGNQGSLIFPLSQRFKAQHCISVVGSNRYMVFDNQGRDTVSRVAEYFVNGYNGSVSLQREYVLPTSLYSSFSGSAYRLPNKNTLIGTGLSAAIVEVDSAYQNVLLDMRQSEQLYRAYAVPTLYEAPPAITFAVVDTFCGSSQLTPVTLVASPAPGFFSGPGVTGNIFDPAAAGPGLHTLVYHYGWATKEVTVGCVGIEDVNGKDIALSLFPNPSTGSVNFSYQLSLNHQARWAIVDLTGKEVASGTNGTASGQVDFAVDLSHLGKGFYLAVLEIGGNRTYSRLVLQ